MARFKGIYANLLTALTPDGNAFEPGAQRDYVEWVVTEGVHGVSTSLSSGEFGYTPSRSGWRSSIASFARSTNAFLCSRAFRSQRCVLPAISPSASKAAVPTPSW